MIGASSHTFASKNHIERYTSVKYARSSPSPGTGASWYGSPNSTTCTPPNGSCGLRRAWRSARSIASMRSALTIETSSMTSVSMDDSSLRNCSDCRMSWSAITPIGSRNSEWMVCPPTLRAATPVGAQITICFDVFSAR